MNKTKYFKIGEISKLTELSADTLRYYEKFGLLPNISRNESGVRLYSEKDLSSLNFIKRAQRMDFSLAEIKDLLQMRQNPKKARKGIRLLTQQKLEAINNSLEELTTLRNELTLLLNLCHSSKDGCPIIKAMDTKKAKP